MSKKYVLVDDTHPKFNRYKVLLESGESYYETFGKEVNPNTKAYFDELNFLLRPSYIRKRLMEGASTKSLSKELDIEENGIRCFKNKFYKDINESEAMNELALL